MECARWILDLEEGVVRRVPQWDEWIFPTPRLNDALEEELRRIRKEFGDEKSTAGRKAKQMIKDARWKENKLQEGGCDGSKSKET